MPGVSSGFGKGLGDSVAEKRGTTVTSNTFPKPKGGPLGEGLNRAGNKIGREASKQVPSGKATTRKKPLVEPVSNQNVHFKDNSKSKSKLNKRFNKPIGTGLVKRTRANSSGKATRVKSVLNNKSGGKNQNKLG